MPQYVDKKKSTETNPKKIKIVHHGVANRNRRIENMIEIVSRAEKRYYLDLYLTGDLQYRNELLGNLKSSRIRILEPVPYEQLIPTLSSYDLGMIYIKPETINLKYSLPNKFFEYIQARIAIFSGPTLELKNILQKHATGFVCNEFTISSAIKLLNGISAREIDEHKRKSFELAKIYNFENEVKKTGIF